MICVRNDTELQSEVFTPDVYVRLAKDGSLFRDFMRLFETGCMFDSNMWYNKVVAQVTNGETTFMEAFKRTGRILNITGY